jgi:hypothetical protein
MTDSTLSPEEAIKRIMNALSLIHVFPDPSNISSAYQGLMKVIHPDICHLPDAKEAAARLNHFKDEAENGITFKDDVCSINYKFKTVVFTGDEKIIKLSFDNYNKLMSKNDPDSKFFQQYIPLTGRLLAPTKLEFTLPLRGVPMGSVGTVEQKHANWMLNRMLEFCGWLNQEGLCHGGLNPDSVFIIPENHGFICTSFYHLTPLGAPMKTISGKFRHLYPNELFTNKTATPNIDIELAKRSAIFMLGDHSGIGTKLRKTHENEILDFLVRSDSDPKECMREHKAILSKYFNTKQFHIFNY